MEKILVVEDDDDIAGIIDYNARRAGLDLERAADGVEGLRMALENKYDLIVLDIMLPELDGTEICKRIRAIDPLVPIIFLTAKSMEVDKIECLNMGADDYMTKPFSGIEFAARLKSLLRRQKAQHEAFEEEQQGSVKVGNLEINIDRRKVSRENNTIELSAKEFELLTFLALRPDRTFTREELMVCVWGSNFNGQEHTVNSTIQRLRSKIEENPRTPNVIQTVWGIGYRFAPNAVYEKE